MPRLMTPVSTRTTKGTVTPFRVVVLSASAGTVSGPASGFSAAAPLAL